MPVASASQPGLKETWSINSNALLFLHIAESPQAAHTIIWGRGPFSDGGYIHENVIVVFRNRQAAAPYVAALADLR